MDGQILTNFTSGGKQLSFSTNDFTRWAFSDLISNAVRGLLAEFIVAKSLGIGEADRIEWDAYDLAYKGVKIEVKSSAYIQTWKKDKYSKPPV